MNALPSRTPRGAIRAERITHELDQSGATLAVWERGPDQAVSLHWSPAGQLTAADITSVLTGAKTASVAIGRGDFSSGMLDHAIAQLPAGCRMYVYAPRTLEVDAARRATLHAAIDRVLPRLGHDLPVDFLVVDGGRAGLLAFGPNAERRWFTRVEGAVARSLFEAFCRLFWFHSSREGLPDAAGSVAFRPPLPAPFADPGPSLALAAGWLAIDADLPEDDVEADLRILPDGTPTGRAATVLMPPRAEDFATPARLTASGTRVVWVDTGAPRAMSTRERLVLDFVEAPVSLRLEWPKADALEFYHRLDKASRKPTWTFHAARRLDRIAGPALIEGAQAPEAVRDIAELRLENLEAPLDAFATAMPEELPAPPALAKRVRYSFEIVPQALPDGAAPSALGRQWSALDGWARRRVETLTTALAAAARWPQEPAGLRDEVRARSEHATARARLIDRLTMLGEAPPSRDPSKARLIAQDLSKAEDDLEVLLAAEHDAVMAAWNAHEEEEQHAAWSALAARDATELAAQRTRLAELEVREATAAHALETAESQSELEGVRADRASVTRRLRELEGALRPFTFVPPKAAPAPRLDKVAPPVVPSEALPCVGELHELAGRRFLAVRTWEQVSAARGEAQRLRAELVANPR